MKKAIYLATLIFAVRAMGQSIPDVQQTSRPAFRSDANLVIVPALVRTLTGEVVTNLGAGDFRLTDDGLEQKVFAERLHHQPLAIMVVMQTGGTAVQEFQNYDKLGAMLDRITCCSPHQVGLLTFDSRREEIWPFPPRSDGLEYALSSPQGGDQGAAIMDAVNFAAGLLEQWPANFRRVIFLLSQAQDEGSRTAPEDLLRRLDESDVTVYSATFPAKKRKKQPAGNQSDLEPSSSASASENPNSLVSLASAIYALRENTATELAVWSGGENVRFQDREDLGQGVSALANELYGSYTLSFRSNSKQPGFHAIAVRVQTSPTSLEVSAPKSYWLNPISQWR